jgi:hypothetical protein
MARMPGATAIVQHALAGQVVPGDPAQAHAGGGMRAGSKRQARVQPDHLTGLRGRLVPGRHNPELRRDLHRRKLRLGQPHPVLVGHRGDPQHTCSLQRTPAPATGARFGGITLARNSASRRERCQPSLGGGMPGSPNRACSASVWASASSTDTLSASSASSASLRTSTRSSGCQQTEFKHQLIVSACVATATLQGSGCWCRRS